MDRIAQIALIFFGALLMVLLVLGLAVSCRETSADPIVTPTIATGPGTPSVGTDVAGGTDNVTLAAPVGSATTQGQATATATPIQPTVPSGGEPTTLTPGTSPTAIATGIATAIAGATPAQPGTSSSGMVPGTTIRHAVARGEWLLQIARCYGVTYESLRAANWIPYPDYILPGAVLTVPNIGSQGSIIGPPCVVIHTVVAGDSWETLAQRYHTTTAIIQRANPGALTVGRSIWVPRVP